MIKGIVRMNTIMPRRNECWKYREGVNELIGGMNIHIYGEERMVKYRDYEYTNAKQDECGNT